MATKFSKPLVNFLIGGTQKGGTTALDTYLRRHPQLQLANSKEVHFFDNDQYFTSAKPDYDWYHSHFCNLQSTAIRGESTPIYMYWKSSAERIHRYNAAMKIILLLRNPIERAYSHWNMEYQRGNETLPFYDAIVNEAARCSSSPDGRQHRVYSYVDRGFYSRQIKNLLSFFPSTSIHIVKSEFLRDQPDQCLKEICAFLGIPHLSNTSPLRAHQIGYPRPMEGREWSYLHSIFQDEINALAKMLGWDCQSWLANLHEA